MRFLWFGSSFDRVVSVSCVRWRLQWSAVAGFTVVCRAVCLGAAGSEPVLGLLAPLSAFLFCSCWCGRVCLVSFLVTVARDEEVQCNNNGTSFRIHEGISALIDLRYKVMVGGITRIWTINLLGYPSVIVPITNCFCNGL
ncbi:hypothetical protein Q3G72_014301 [Acer saccharum]|nr:hypothetical protein Q3G72_014301 [Acer saccharum]